MPTTFYWKTSETWLVIKICHLISKDDLENQGQSYIFKFKFKLFLLQQQQTDEI